MKLIRLFLISMLLFGWIGISSGVVTLNSSTNRIIVDASADADEKNPILTNKRVSHFIYIGDDVGDACVVSDDSGNTVWQTTTSVAGVPNTSPYYGIKYDSLKIDTNEMDSGVLLIVYEQ